MADEWSASIVLSEVVSNIAWFVEEHSALLVHTFEIQLILLGLWVEVLVNLVPFWWDSFKLLVWRQWYKRSFSLAHVIYHFVNFYQILCSVQLANWLLGGLALELVLWLLIGILDGLCIARASEEWAFYSEDKWSFLTYKLCTAWAFLAPWWAARISVVTKVWTVAECWQLSLMVIMSTALANFSILLLLLGFLFTDALNYFQ